MKKIIARIVSSNEKSNHTTVTSAFFTFEKFLQILKVLTVITYRMWRQQCFVNMDLNWKDISYSSLGLGTSAKFTIMYLYNAKLSLSNN